MAYLNKVTSQSFNLLKNTSKNVLINKCVNLKFPITSISQYKINLTSKRSLFTSNLYVKNSFNAGKDYLKLKQSI